MDRLVAGFGDDPVVDPVSNLQASSDIMSDDANIFSDQPQHEWVIVLQGAAKLQFDDGMVEMKVGDFINIPAFKKHRVDWTTPDEPTVWLGVRYGDVGSGGPS